MRIINVMLAKGLGGGIEQSFLDYSHVLQALGHEVHSVVHPKVEVLKLIDAPPAQVHTLANMGEWDIFASWQLGRMLSGLKPYVAIAHGNRALRLLARAHARPLVTVMHNYKIRAAYAHAVIAPTRDLMRHAAEQGVARERLHVVPNMVRVPAEMPVRTWQKKPVIGAMGHLVAKKGFEVLLPALAILRSRAVEFRAMIAGDGEEMDALKSQALREGIGYEVEFLGWVKDKREFFDGVDIFCLPSHHEPFGTVLLEAMAQGLPVVSTASEGPSEIISNGMDGTLVPAGEATALADALEDMLLDPRRAQLMGRNAYDTVREKYDMSVVGSKLDLALRAASTL
jgi:glycosyltransferase involved in cell wall biosynthesis